MICMHCITCVYVAGRGCYRAAIRCLKGDLQEKQTGVFAVLVSSLGTTRCWAHDTAKHGRALRLSPPPNTLDNTSPPPRNRQLCTGSGLQCVVLGMPLAPNHTHCQPQLPFWLQPTDPTLARMQTAAAHTLTHYPAWSATPTRLELKPRCACSTTCKSRLRPPPGCCTKRVNTLTTAALALQQPQRASLQQ